MAPRSSIELDPRVKAVVDAALREGHTYSEIVEKLRELGMRNSKSSVHRYGKRFSKVLQRYREKQDIAQIWITEFGKEPEGDIGKLVGELLRIVAHTQAEAMADAEPGDDDGPTPLDVLRLSSAIKELASADKISADRVLKVRRETATKAADAAAKVATVRGLSPEAVAEIRSKILGVAA